MHAYVSKQPQLSKILIIQMFLPGWSQLVRMIVDEVYMLQLITAMSEGNEHIWLHIKVGVVWTCP